jgi:hypothetical protein
MNDFERVLKQRKEEPCQRFLTRNQDILLESFRKDRIIPKFRFGNEFVSDFVLYSETSLGPKITLVELEPPNEKPFTDKGKYARRLNDAIGQVNDWMAWIAGNKDYFCRSLDAGIFDRDLIRREHKLIESMRQRQPYDLVDAKIIIGRRSHLTVADDKRRAAVFRSTNKTIGAW